MSTQPQELALYVCRACGESYDEVVPAPGAGFSPPCPHCGSWRLDVAAPHHPQRDQEDAA